MILSSFTGDINLLQSLSFRDLHREPQYRIGKYITDSQNSK